MDIIRNSPGKLYVGDTYMSCYCYSGEAKEYEDEFYASDYEIGIMQAKPPFWVKEEKFVFEKYNENEISNFLEYPYDYEFDYMGTQKGTSSIEVEHYSESTVIRDDHLRSCYESTGYYWNTYLPGQNDRGRK